MTSFTSRKEDFNFIAGKKKEEIISAIRRGSKNELMKLISDKDLNITFLADENSILEEDQFTGITILHYAVNLKRKKIVQYLLGKGAQNIPEYNCSLGSNSKLLFTPFDDAINQKNFDIAYLIENIPGENIVVSSTLVGKECIDEYNLWKIDKRKKNDQKKINLLQEMTKGFESLEIEKIGNKRKKDSNDKKDSDTLETPISSLEYERNLDSDGSED